MGTLSAKRRRGTWWSSCVIPQQLDSTTSLRPLLAGTSNIQGVHKMWSRMTMRVAQEMGLVRDRAPTCRTCLEIEDEGAKAKGPGSQRGCTGVRATAVHRQPQALHRELYGGAPVAAEPRGTGRSTTGRERGIAAPGCTDNPSPFLVHDQLSSVKNRGQGHAPCCRYLVVGAACLLISYMSYNNVECLQWICNRGVLRRVTAGKALPLSIIVALATPIVSISSRRARVMRSMPLSGSRSSFDMSAKSRGGERRFSCIA